MVVLGIKSEAENLAVSDETEHWIYVNLHGYTVYQWYQILYNPTNAHVEFIKTN